MKYARFTEIWRQQSGNPVTVTSMACPFQLEPTIFNTLDMSESQMTILNFAPAEKHYARLSSIFMAY